MTATPPRRAAGASTSSVSSVAKASIALLIMVGCARSHQSPQTQLYHPPAYHPEQFPDIPMFPLGGYVLTPEEDQLAIAFAGGTVRRFEVSMRQRDGAKDDPPSAVLERYDSEMPPLGWTRLAPGHWRKGTEELVIEAGRSGGLTSIRFHLLPCDAAPTDAGATNSPAKAGP